MWARPPTPALLQVRGRAHTEAWLEGCDGCLRMGRSVCLTQGPGPAAAATGWLGSLLLPGLGLAPPSPPHAGPRADDDEGP
jgi:hypothetical protein